MERTLALVVLLGAYAALMPAYAQPPHPGPPRPEPPGVVSIELPPPDNTFKPGAGQDIAAGQCVICHAADYVYTQPPMPQDKWKATVTKMQKVFGCPVEDQNVQALAAYLAQQNGPKK